METATSTTRRRGQSRASLDLVAAAQDILAEIQPASVRAVGYQLFTRKLIPSMARSEMNKLSKLLTRARENETIPWDHIVDETREPERVSAWQDPAAYVESVRRSYRRDRWTDQPRRIEVWSEKGTVRGTLAPVLHDYGVTFRVMHGYASATAVREAAQDSLTGIHGGKTFTTVLYVGDWDPSGLAMSEMDLPRRLDAYGGIVLVKRVALDWQDIGDDLPSFPASEKTKDPRYQWFVKEYGSRCWELDVMDQETCGTGWKSLSGPTSTSMRGIAPKWWRLRSGNR